ncbi:hypothetical protein NMY22_g217 [Coprinellus aureogranulatus]|nr:hypothetical protein NMY22_g217 [Coprinellus aureogranulatus]
MLFKLTTVALAAAALATASPAVLKRGLATCTLTVTPSGVPDTTEVPLLTEWNYLIGRTFADSVPSGTIIDGTGNVVTGPNADGTYTIDTGIGSPAVTDAEATATVNGWEGRTFTGPWSGVTWHIDNVVCA